MQEASQWHQLVSFKPALATSCVVPHYALSNLAQKSTFLCANKPYPDWWNHSPTALFVSVPCDKINDLPTQDREKQAQMGIVSQYPKSCADKQSKTHILDPYETKESRCGSTGLAINLPCTQRCGFLYWIGSFRTSQLPPEPDLQPSAWCGIASHTNVIPLSAYQQLLVLIFYLKLLFSLSSEKISVERTMLWNTFITNQQNIVLQLMNISQKKGSWYKVFGTFYIINKTKCRENTL